MTPGKVSSEREAISEGPIQLAQAPREAPGENLDRTTLACRIVTDADRDAWNEFVSSHASGNLGHQFEWKQVIEGAYRKKAYYLAASEDGQWVGVLPLVHMKGPLTGNRLVSLPFLDQAGILARSDAATAALQAAAQGIAAHARSRGFDLRAAGPPDMKDAERATLVLPLPRSAEALWKSFSTKVRNQVRKSEKEGLKTEPAAAGGLDEFYGVFSRNMRDLGSPVHAKEFLAAVLRAFSARAKLYLTRDSAGRPVGGAVAISSGATVTVPWASSLREVFASCPNHSLYWRILSDAVAGGAEQFDFGRSHADSGTYRFKTQWGAEPRPLLWSSFDAQGAPEAQKVYKPAEHQRLTTVWSRLPLAAANFLGPLIRRQLSN